MGPGFPSKRLRVFEELATDQQMYGVGKPIEQHSGMHRD